MMMGVGCVLLCCVLFVHMGLGDMVCKVVKRNLSLFGCVKCLTFWTTAAYTYLYSDFSPAECAAIAFITAYLALWVELFFSKLAVWYEKKYKGVVTEEGKCDASDGDKKNKG